MNLQLSRALADHLHKCGWQTRVATNLVELRPTTHIDILIHIGGFKRRSGEIKYLSNLGLLFARALSFDLWAEHTAYFPLHSSTTERSYSLVRMGTVPLHIIIPGNSLSILNFQDRLSPTIANSLTNTLIRYNH